MNCTQALCRDETFVFEALDTVELNMNTLWCSIPISFLIALCFGYFTMEKYRITLEILFGIAALPQI